MKRPNEAHKHYVKMLASVKQEVLEGAEQDPNMPAELAPRHYIYDSALPVELDSPWHQHLRLRLAALRQRYQWAEHLLNKLASLSPRGLLRWRSGLFFDRVATKLKSPGDISPTIPQQHKLQAWDRFIARRDPHAHLSNHTNTDTDKEKDHDNDNDVKYIKVHNPNSHSDQEHANDANKVARLIVSQWRRSHNPFHKLLHSFRRLLSAQFGAGSKSPAASGLSPGSLPSPLPLPSRLHDHDMKFDLAGEEEKDRRAATEELKMPMETATNVVHRNIQTFTQLLLDTLCIFYKGLINPALLDSVKGLLHVYMLDAILKGQVFAMVYKHLVAQCAGQQLQLLEKTAEFVHAPPATFGINPVLSLTHWELTAEAEATYFKPQWQAKMLVSKEPAAATQPYERVLEQMGKMSQAEGVLGKLVVFEELLDLIGSSIEDHWQRALRNGINGLDESQVTKILCYVITKANAPELLAQVGLLQVFCTSAQTPSSALLFRAFRSAVSELLSIPLQHVQPKLPPAIPDSA